MISGISQKIKVDCIVLFPVTSNILSGKEKEKKKKKEEEEKKCLEEPFSCHYMAINLLSRAEPRQLNYLYMFCISLLKKNKKR